MNGMQVITHAQPLLHLQVVGSLADRIYKSMDAVDEWAPETALNLPVSLNADHNCIYKEALTGILEMIDQTPEDASRKNLDELATEIYQYIEYIFNQEAANGHSVPA